MICSMPACIGNAIGTDHSKLDSVLQRQVQRTTTEGCITIGLTILANPAAAPNTLACKFVLHREYRPERKIVFEVRVHLACALLTDDELAILHLITERHDTTHPHSMGL